MRLLFVADVHGSTAVLRKSIRAARDSGVSVLIVAGDLCGKHLVPLVRLASGAYRVTLRGRAQEVEADHLPAVQSRLAEQGMYFFECSVAEVDALRSDPAGVERIFRQRMLDRLDEWKTLLTSGLDMRQVQVFITPGNDDPFELDDLLQSFEPEGIRSHAGEPHTVGGCELITLDHSNPTPWETPREVPEMKLEQLIEAKIKRLAAPERAIFNFHPPPAETRLDLAPKLDRDLKPVLVSGTDNRVHVGSRAVRAAIEAVRPLLGLHGHVHEAAGEDWVGRTLCLNPGSEYWNGTLCGYVVNIGDKGVGSYFRVDG